ncbi:MAG: hypothetical protein Q8P27_00415 [Candidatus Peregrinibacteria bacterium]|nr:hypothetical protein [Candidatus Peregrinibacteria bacterium]
MFRSFLISLSSLLLVFSVGCGSTGEDGRQIEGASVDSEGNVVATEVSDERVLEIEAKVGFSLADDAEIFTDLEGESVYIFSYYTDWSTEEVQSLYEGEFASYEMTEGWDLVSFQNWTSTTGEFESDDVTISIAIDDQDGSRLVNMSLWY